MTPFESMVPVEDVLDSGAPRGAPVPWWAKIAAKIVLSRVLPSYAARKSFGLFLHGNLDRNIDQHAAYVSNVLAQHGRCAAAKPAALLELGPGNSLGTALFARAHGVDRIWLADVGDFATSDMTLYRCIARRIDDEQPGFAARVDLADRARMLASLNAAYLTGGTVALATIPDDSLDVIMSTAVLEHVRLSEFSQLAAEMLRLLRPGGIAFHQVDLMDHLGGAQNHLRFSRAWWEHPLLANAGFYTNRLRCREIVTIMRGAGFEAAVIRVARWPVAPTPRHALAEPFRTMPDDELRIANFGLLLRKPG